jgi:hypothetical protein
MHRVLNYNSRKKLMFENHARDFLKRQFYEIFYFRFHSLTSFPRSVNLGVVDTGGEFAPQCRRSKPLVHLEL